MTESRPISPQGSRSAAFKWLNVVSRVAMVLAASALGWNILCAYGPPVFRSQISCAEAECRVGTLPEPANIEHVFVLRNLGWKPLTIENIQVDCRCSRVSPLEFPQTVAPGSSLDVISRVNLKGITGPFRKVLRVRSNDPFQPVLELAIRGEVASPSRALTPIAPALETSLRNSSHASDGPSASVDVEP